MPAGSKISFLQSVSASTRTHVLGCVVGNIWLHRFSLLVPLVCLKPQRAAHTFNRSLLHRTDCSRGTAVLIVASGPSSPSADVIVCRPSWDSFLLSHDLFTGPLLSLAFIFSHSSLTFIYHEFVFCLIGIKLDT